MSDLKKKPFHQQIKIKSFLGRFEDLINFVSDQIQHIIEKWIKALHTKNKRKNISTSLVNTYKLKQIYMNLIDTSSSCWCAPCQCYTYQKIGSLASRQLWKDLILPNHGSNLWLDAVIKQTIKANMLFELMEGMQNFWSSARRTWSISIPHQIVFQCPWCSTIWTLMVIDLIVLPPPLISTSCNLFYQSTSSH